MNYIVDVQIDGQRLKFRDCSSIHIPHPEIYDKIIINPIFSKEWDGLYKYVTFSIDCLQHITKKAEEGTIPFQYLKSPGVAFYFWGKEKDTEEHKYHIQTNFLMITMEDVKCQY
jgi:hypothetical protein